MSAPVFIAVAFGSSVIAGMVGALLGLGGGIIVVPVLVLALRVPIQYAAGASIISVIATSSAAAAAYVRDRLTNLRIGLFLETATTTGAVTGALLARVVGGRALYVLFGLVLAYSALMMFRRRNAELCTTAQNHPWAKRLRLASCYPEPAQGGLVQYNVAGVPLALGLMYGAGVISGLLGIGSGALKVPAMDLAMKLPIKVSSATSNFMIGVTAAASAGVYFARGDVVPLIAAPVALGVLLGALAGARLMCYMRGKVIRYIFVVVLCFISVQMILKGLGLALY
jgi:uncharacterized membrane protein YfcA